MPLLNIVNATFKLHQHGKKVAEIELELEGKFRDTVVRYEEILAELSIKLVLVNKLLEKHTLDEDESMSKVHSINQAHSSFVSLHEKLKKALLEQQKRISKHNDPKASAASQAKDYIHMRTQLEEIVKKESACLVEIKNEAEHAATRA